MMKDGLAFKDEKTKKVTSLANELSNSSKGEIVYISNCSDAKNHLDDGIKFLDLSEIEFMSAGILTAVIEQLSFENKNTEIILIDNLSKMIEEGDIENFLREVDIISSRSKVKILFGLDKEKKSTIDSLDIEKID